MRSRFAGRNLALMLGASPLIAGCGTLVELRSQLAQGAATNGEDVTSFEPEFLVPLRADAGPDHALPINQIGTLDGSATGGDGDYTYQWQPSDGLSDPHVVRPELTLNTAGTLEYTLVVTDGEGTQDADSVTVTVHPLLLADAGPDVTLIQGEAWVLTGSAEGGDGDYRFAWSPTAGLSDPNFDRVLLTSEDLPIGPLEFTLAVTDGTGVVAIDTVTVTIEHLRASVSPSPPGPAPPTVIDSVRWAVDFGGGGYQVLVAFSQPVDQATAETVTNYRLTGTGTNPVAATLAGDQKTVTLTFAVPLAVTQAIDVSLGNAIKDQNGADVAESLNQAIAANAGDVTTPTLASATWAADFAGGYQIVLVFGEALDETSAETLANYRINGTATNPTTAALGTDGLSVTLTFTTLALATADTLDVSVGASVTDINGQAMTQVTGQAIAANGADVTAPTLTSATWAANFATGGYQILIVFDEAIDETSAETLANYRINGTASNPTSAVLAADGRNVTLTFTTLALGVADALDVSVGASVTDVNAQAAAQVTGQAIAANAEATVPTVVSANRQGAKNVNIVFSEAVDRATVEAAAYTFTGAAVLSAAVLQPDGVTVRVTVTGANLAGETVTVPATIKDINGNTLAAPYVSGAL